MMDYAWFFLSAPSSDDQHAQEKTTNAAFEDQFDSRQEEATQPPKDTRTQEEIDLEDGEIEDDDEENGEGPQEAQDPSQNLQQGVSPSKSDKSTPKKLLEDDQNVTLSPSHSERSLERHSRIGESSKAQGAIPWRSPDTIQDSYWGSKERDKDKSRRGNKREEKKERIKEEKAGHKHLTEAEKSILHLRKREKLLRVRDDRHRDIDKADDDFAKNIEKTLATILHKKEKEMAALNSGNEEEKEVKRGKKRKKHDKKERNKAKHKRLNMDSPRSEMDESEMLNIRSGSPGGGPSPLSFPDPMLGPMGGHKRSRSPSSSESYYEEEYSAPEEREDAGTRGMNRRGGGRFNNRDRDHRDRGGRDNRDRNWRNNNKKDRNNMRNNRRDRDMRRGGHEMNAQKHNFEPQDAQGVCVFYMQGKCQKHDCPYSHEVCPPMKLELCKFYVLECCAKGDNCSYMHGEFPCKFYHTGLQCTDGDNCKFAHGKPLTEQLKQILFKHIETAPRDILGGFPRLNREEALNLINQTQKKLQIEYTNQGEAASYQEGQGGYQEEQNKSLSQEGMKAIEDFLKGGTIPSLFDVSVPIPSELINDTDIALPPSNTLEKKQPKVTRWQQKDNAGFPNQFSYGSSDQDMRFSSNGDIDMRTLPNLSASNSHASLQSNQSIDGVPIDSSMEYQNESSSKKDVDNRQNPGLLNYAKDTDIRQPISFSIKPRDVDIRPQLMVKNLEVFKAEEEEVEGESSQNSQKSDDHKKEETNEAQYAPNVGFSQKTMDLIARITANNPTDLNSIPVPQSDYKPATSSANAATENETTNQLQQEQREEEEERHNAEINWYSDEDSDDENKLTIKVEEEETRRDSISKDEDDEEMKPVKAENETKISTQATVAEEIKPVTDIVGKLGDLSKIDISAEVTKLLSSMSKQSKLSSPTTSRLPKEEEALTEEGSSSGGNSPSTSRKSGISDPRKQSSRRDSSSSQESNYSPKPERRPSASDFKIRDPREKPSKDDPRDPRSSRQDSRSVRDSKDRAAESKTSRETKEKERKDPRMGLEDPRGKRKGSTEEKLKNRSGKMSIYEQGGLDMQAAALNDIDPDEIKAALRPDIDLRNMGLPFKGMQNYTPATEIDASLNSHPPMVWRVTPIEVPRPDYTGLKLSINDAEKTGDPRLKKLFRLSTDEKESPMSPMSSPKASAGVRVDPRQRKNRSTDEKPSTISSQPQEMTYNQQLSILQSSQFYQSLTSNQKLMLNQELADRYEPTPTSDSFLFSLLSNLNLLPGGTQGLPPISSLGGVPGLPPSMLPNLPPTALPMLAAQQGIPLGQQGLLGAAPGIPNIPVDFQQINFDPRNGGLLGSGPPMFGPQGPYGMGPLDLQGPYGGNEPDFYGDPGNQHDGGVGNFSHRGGGGGNFRGGQHRNNDRNFRDNRRRGGGRNNNFNNRNNNRDFKNNRGDRGGRNNRRDDNRQGRHYSPE